MLLDYLNKYNAETECPRRYHQWCYISALASMLGRNAWLEFGHRAIYPNMYIMLIGSPAARKNTAMNASVDVIRALNMLNIAQGRTSKEKFLLDLSGHVDDTGTKHNAEQGAGSGTAEMYKNLFDMDLADLANDDSIHETLIAADEFTNFVGAGNYEFISLLGELWDNPPIYDVRVKNSKSYKISKPCVNILGGNTPTGFAAAFPPEMIGQGFLSRLLLVYGERTDVRITWPEPPDMQLKAELSAHFARVRMEITGVIAIDRKGEAFAALDWIYKNWQSLDDVRFASYSGRRFSHLLKLCLIFAANALRTEILLEDVIAANTLLAVTENDMPKALGEFGKSKHSDIVNKIMDFLYTVDTPQNINSLWKLVQTDLVGDGGRAKLADLLTGLVSAEKVQNLKGGFLPVRKRVKENTMYFNASLIGGI